MNVQVFHPDGNQILFQPINSKKYRGTLLPGSEIQQSNTWAAIITMQEFQNPLFRIGHRLMEVLSKIKFTINDTAALRLEALLSGEMHLSVNGQRRKFRAGEYRITDVPLFTTLFKKQTSCSIFISHCSTELLKQLGMEIAPCEPRRMPDAMVNLINEAFRNPYTEELWDFYYENCIRELLFLHLAQGKNVMPGELMYKDIALVYKADAIIASNIREHYSIAELARMINTNSLKLKTGFNKVYGMGVFRRLIFRRMEHAKTLLATTDKLIDEIAGLTGYDSTAAFIHAFRKAFGLTPREWRIQERNTDNEEND